MCESWARVEPVDRSKRLSTFHATPSMSSKAVMKDGKPRNQSTTRNHTSSSFRVQPCLCLRVVRGLAKPCLTLYRRVARQTTSTALPTALPPYPPVAAIRLRKRVLQYHLRCSEAEHGEMTATRQAQRPSAQTACRQGHCITVAPSLNHLCLRCQEHIHPATLTE